MTKKPSAFDFRLHDGTKIGDLKWSDISRYIEESERLAAQHKALAVKAEAIAGKLKAGELLSEDEAIKELRHAIMTAYASGELSADLAMRELHSLEFGRANHKSRPRRRASEEAR